MVLEFRLLGPLEVLRDGHALPLGGARQKALLAALLLHAGQAVSAERLIDELWGEEPPATAPGVLQSYVSRLRRVLEDGAPGEPVIAGVRPGYVLRVDGARFDLAELETLRRAADEARLAGDPAAASERYRRALGLFRGLPLADFRYEDFAAAEIERLDELRLATLEARIEADLACGRHAELTGELRGLVLEHPFREGLRGALVTALYRSGRQAEALEAYRAARDTLADELGIDPSPALQRLESAVLNQDPALEWVPARPAVTPGSVEDAGPGPARSNLPEPSSTAPDPLTGPAPPPLREERKVVTILVCGLEARSHGVDTDPEDLRDAFRPAQELVTREIGRFGGTLERASADSVVGVFGAPVAHEDDAERAIRAGLAILAGLAGQEGGQTAVEARIGVATGTVLVSSADAGDPRPMALTGDVLATAARLHETSALGAMVADEATWRLTAAAVDFEGADPVAIRGRREPVRAWRARAARSRFGVDLPGTPATRFVGRQLEVAALRGAYQRALRAEGVQLVTITGEPGIGKSRLVAELGAWIDDQPELVSWRQGRCPPYGDGITFWALGEIVKAHTGILDSDDIAVAGAKIDGAVPDSDPDAPWLRQRLRPLVGLEAPRAGRDELFTAWRRFLELVASGGPAVFLFEDIHWADAAMLAFVEHVADWSDRVPLLLVCTARPELHERHPGWAGGKRNATTINLAPLSASETAELVAELGEATSLSPGVRSLVVEQAGGNPLYAEEFIRMLRDQGPPADGGRSLPLAGSSAARLPGTIQALIAARLDTLPAERKALLHDAAVVGKVFWAGAITAMRGLDEWAVGEALHELSRKELVRPARQSSLEGQVEYAFRHSLVRDVCYEQIPRSSRADRHQRAAAWIEAVAGDRVEDKAEILAAHYLAALELVRAGRGAEPAELEAKTAKYLVLAGDRAMGIDIEIAERHYALALELTPVTHPSHADILGCHAVALQQRGRFPEAADAFEEAIGALRARNEVRAAARLMGSYSSVLERTGDPRWRTLEAQAVAALEPLGPSPELAQALAGVAGTELVLGNYRAAIVAADRAIALARRLDLAEPARALGFRGAARCWAGEAGGLEDIRRALDQATSQGLGREAALLRYNLAEILRMTDPAPAVLEAQRDAAAFAERRGIEEFAFFLACAMAETLVDTGSVDEALWLIESLAPRLEGAGDVTDLVQLRASQSMALNRRGRNEEAVPLAAWAVERARELDSAQLASMVCAPASLVRLGLGDRAGAIAILTELGAAANRREPEYVANLPDAVRTALSADSPGLAGRLVEGVEPAFPRHDHALASVGALLHEHRGEHAEAAACFANAAQRWEAFGVPWEHAHALFGRGRCLLALGRNTEATESLLGARGIFAGLGAGPSMEEIDALLSPSVPPIPGEPGAPPAEP